MSTSDLARGYLAQMRAELAAKKKPTARQARAELAAARRKTETTEIAEEETA